MLNRESYKGAEGAVAYHNIKAELGYKAATGSPRPWSASATTRCGSRSATRTSWRTWSTSGRPGGRASGADGSRTARHVRSTSTSRRRRAVRPTSDFIETGRLPRAGDAGASDPTTAVSTTDTSSGQAAVDFGPRRPLQGRRHARADARLPARARRRGRPGRDGPGDQAAADDGGREDARRRAPRLHNQSLGSGEQARRVPHELPLRHAAGAPQAGQQRHRHAARGRLPEPPDGLLRPSAPSPRRSRP